MRRHTIVTVCLLTLAAAVAGCGGSGYTRADFVARANAICASALRQTRSIPPPHGNALAAYLDQVLPIVESEARQLRSLQRPKGTPHQNSTLDRYAKALGQLVVDYQDLATAARQNDPHGVATAVATLSASPVTSLAASYGLNSCATAGPTVR